MSVLKLLFVSEIALLNTNLFMDLKKGLWVLLEIILASSWQLFTKAIEIIEGKYCCMNLNGLLNMQT